uniref:Aconitate decarboxylase 1 n=1 Tax=Gasterosteus aculeatus aculeatus TaxID=481459 RepID=A0AAQ4RDM0_GASAC
MLRKGITGSFGAAIHGLNTPQLTDGVINRSKRMMLDTLGVGLIGTRTDVFKKALAYSKLFRSDEMSRVWGQTELSLPPPYAAFVNGIAVHSMDFDDTWHPATHPSGAVLPALLALAKTLPRPPSGLDLLLAFNVGIEVQGRLMRFSREAYSIPERFHPPSVVGVMGSAAASAKLLGLSPAQCAHALAIAASSAGAPLANAATQTKPLHVGNAARRGLEAAQLARMGLEGNPDILDVSGGFGVYYKDYGPSAMEGSSSTDFRWILEDQDVAFKRIPAHLGMHWAVDAALAARAKLVAAVGNFDLGRVRKVTLRVPPSKAHVDRPALKELLSKVQVETPGDNPPSFDQMYCEVEIETAQGQSHAARCDTFYGHWRKPLSQEDLVEKFSVNASSVLCTEGVEGVIDVVGNIESVRECSILNAYLSMTSGEEEQLYSTRSM